VEATVLPYPTEGLSCAQARPHLEAMRDESAANESPALRAHLHACAACRTALLIRRALHLAYLPQPLDCSYCRDELAQFVDRERSDGPRTAIRLYPGVWWHLWMCEECLAAYDRSWRPAGA
jgi:predicted anti-sigma-YlaC factor YlaD